MLLFSFIFQGKDVIFNIALALLKVSNSENYGVIKQSIHYISHLLKTNYYFSSFCKTSKNISK